MTQDFWIGVAVALVVSVVANLITPITRTALVAVVVRIGNGARAFGTWGLRSSLSNSEKELAQLDDFYAHPEKFQFMALNAVAINLFVVWAIAVAVGIAIFGGWLPGDNARTVFFSLLGASTSIFGRLLVTQAVAEHLQSYEKYRPTILKRIETLRMATGLKTSEG